MHNRNAPLRVPHTFPILLFKWEDFLELDQLKDDSYQEAPLDMWWNEAVKQLLYRADSK